MKYNYNDFIQAIKTYIEFRVEWDDEQLNHQYGNFKEWLKGLDQAWCDRMGAYTLYTEFIIDFYAEANPDTHDYWIGDY